MYLKLSLSNIIYSSHSEPKSLLFYRTRLYHNVIYKLLYRALFKRNVISLLKLSIILMALSFVSQFANIFSSHHFIIIICASTYSFLLLKLWLLAWLFLFLCCYYLYHYQNNERKARQSKHLFHGKLDNNSMMRIRIVPIEILVILIIFCDFSRQTPLLTPQPAYFKSHFSIGNIFNNNKKQLKLKIIYKVFATLI